MSVQALLEGSAIKRKQWSVQTITPLLMHGWDSREKAETRASSIKGVIRYWWRALQPKTEGLLVAENKLFGGTQVGADQRGSCSPLMIRVEKLTDTTRYSIRPHRDFQSGMSPGIVSGKTFTVEISVLNKHAPFFEDYKTLVELVLAIGGFGQRSRRGFGSLQIMDEHWQTVEEYRLYIENHILKLTTLHWPEWKDAPDTRHPILRNIWVGAPEHSPKDALQTIGQASSRAKASASSGGYLLGGTNPRLASPLHVSVRRVGQSYHPVVAETCLRKHPASDYIAQRNLFLSELGVKIDA